MKLKKKRKSKRMRGSGTHGWGARKKHLGSGHRGGFGMAGTGKRADHKKSLIINLYGTGYFGKQGITSKSTKKRINNVLNLDYIEKNLERLSERYGRENGVLDLSGFKILGRGSDEFKKKVVIKARAISKSAKEKIEAVGGRVILRKEKGKGEGK